MLKKLRKKLRVSNLEKTNAVRQFLGFVGFVLVI